MSIQDRIDRIQERRDFKNVIPSNEEEAKYYNAVKRVKRIKGFYTHAMVYVVINIMFVIINIQNLNTGESYFQWQNFTTLFFWGIGLTAHAASVFVPEFIFGKNWEQRKIQEFMEKERQQNKWE